MASLGVKPYSFRYPTDLQSVLEPWRRSLGPDYDSVVALLRDRDRSIEDHLSLGVAQGYLGIGFQPQGSFILTAAYQSITGATVTYTIPAGRQIKITAHFRAVHTGAGTTTSFLKIIDATAATLTSDYYNHGASGAPASVTTYNIIYFFAPPAGTHTVTAQSLILDAAGNLECLAGPSNFVSVEDVGPATRA